MTFHVYRLIEWTVDFEKYGTISTKILARPPGGKEIHNKPSPSLKSKMIHPLVSTFAAMIFKLLKYSFRTKAKTVFVTFGQCVPSEQCYIFPTKK